MPFSWEGWVVLCAFAILILAGANWFHPEEHLAAYLAYTVVLSTALLGICWRKGEPPRWRWGKRTPPS